MGERGPQTRGPRAIGDFVGWEMQGREIPGSPGNRGGGVRIFWGGMGCMGAEDPSTFGIKHLDVQQRAGHPAARRLQIFSSTRSEPTADSSWKWPEAFA